MPWITQWATKPQSKPPLAPAALKHLLFFTRSLSLKIRHLCILFSSVCAGWVLVSHRDTAKVCFQLRGWKYSHKVEDNKQDSLKCFLILDIWIFEFSPWDTWWGPDFQKMLSTHLWNSSISKVSSVGDPKFIILLWKSWPYGFAPVQVTAKFGQWCHH